jgi:CxxC-x17-CxxC domain-containing protein
MMPASGPFLATCARCSKEAELPFRPTGTKPVYCDACYTQIRSGSVSPEPITIVTLPAPEPV